MQDKSVIVLLAEGCEEIEAVTVIDLLRRANIKVVAASLEPGVIKASRGVVLVPDMTLDEALNQVFDMVVLPGGMPGSRHLMHDERVLNLVKHYAAQGRWVAAICAAPMVLHAAGLLKGRRVTSFPGVLESLPGTHTIITEAVVVDAPIVTSRGPGTAMDFALTLIEILCGRDTRETVEAALQRI